MNEKLFKASVLTALATELLEVNAAGPCGYWFHQLANRLNDRVCELIKEVERENAR